MLRKFILWLIALLASLTFSYLNLFENSSSAYAQEEAELKIVINNIIFSGNLQFDTESLLKKLPFSIGDAYSEELLQEGKYRLLSFYGEHGFIYATINYETEFSEDTKQCVVTYQINEGIKAYIGNVYIEGTTKTEAKVILRELLFKPGEVYNRKLVFESHRRLLSLGYFEEVKIEPAKPEKQQEIVDLIIKVKEKKTGSIGIGAGYSTEEGYRGYFRYTESNLFGKGQRLNIRLSFAEEGELYAKGREIKLEFLDPYFLEKPLKFGSSLYWRRENLENYSIRREGAEVSLSHTFSFDTTIKGTVKYRIEDVNIFNVKNEIDQTIKDLEGTEYQLGALSYKVSKDTRDNLYYPTRGSLNSLTAELVHEFLFSDANFVKIIFDHRFYLSVQDLLAHDLQTTRKKQQFPTVLAFRTNIGLGKPLEEDESLPITERFYAGGLDSLRGFKARYLGPKDLDGYPIGGEAMAIFNLELRFALYKKLIGLLFYDCGNVWSTIDKIDLSELESGIGCGIRYQTPIGPLGLDYGIRIPKVDKGRVYLSIGYSF